MKLCKHFLITGKVQGVYFRDSTRKKACELAVTGWVRNLKDGRVELLACGKLEDLKALESWLWKGPPAAKVYEVRVENQLVEEHPGFEIR
jgi:acylphosphatase